MLRGSNEIKTMPNYFADYDTTVHFITEEEMKRDAKRASPRRLCDTYRDDGMNDEHKHVIE